MKIDINLLETTYVSTEKSIPIVVKISSNDKIKIAEKIDLKEILLLQNNEPRIGTYTTCHLGLLRDTLVITKNNPHYAMYDVYADSRDIEINPGEYEVFIKLKVYKKNVVGEFEIITLETRKPITIS